MTHKPYDITPDGLILRVYATPRSSRAVLSGYFQDVQGHVYLRAYVNEAPEGGKANQAVVTLISTIIGAGKSSISLKSGQTHRKKVFHISAGNATELAQRVDSLYAYQNTLFD